MRGAGYMRGFAYRCEDLMGYFCNDSLVILDKDIYFRGSKVPAPPKFSQRGNTVAVCNHRLYINGFEWKRGQWKRTVSAWWHKWF